jgi:hypothetical protein
MGEGFFFFFFFFFLCFLASSPFMNEEIVFPKSDNYDYLCQLESR